MITIIANANGGRFSFNSTYLSYVKYVLVEIILQVFVCQVDAKLFKAVHFEILKSKDVQYTN